MGLLGGLAPAIGAAGLAFLVQPVLGVTGVIDLGVTGSPSSLNGYSTVPFNDTRPLGESVTDVALPQGADPVGSLQFDSPLEHQRAGSGWGTWSHSYSGDVYWFDELIAGDTLTVTLPAGTRAFSLFLEPDYFGTAVFDFTIDGTATQLTIAGDGGAHGLGFYASDPADSLGSLVITKASTEFSNGFGLGEFRINGISNMPDGPISPLWLLAVTGALSTLRRRTAA